MQNVQIKMVHDQSPLGPHRYRSLLHATSLITKEQGLASGFFSGFVPTVAKGAVTNCIRFLGYGVITRGFRKDDDEPLASWQTMMAGGVAGVISAIASQPIDTVKANMMGLEGAKFSSTLGCTGQLVRAGGLLALFNGVGPRSARVFVEVGLQFTLFEKIGRVLDKLLAQR